MKCSLLRPMTCPFQYTIYNNGLKSYRDLPIRYGETSTLFRNEASGENDHSSIYYWKGRIVSAKQHSSSFNLNTSTKHTVLIVINDFQKSIKPDYRRLGENVTSALT